MHQILQDLLINDVTKKHDEIAALQWIMNTIVIYLTVSIAFLVYYLWVRPHHYQNN